MQRKLLCATNITKKMAENKKPKQGKKEPAVKGRFFLFKNH